MKKSEDILNVPEIQKQISTKHKSFIKEYGNEIDKVMADHRLIADIILTKLYRIALIFKEERIVDEVQISDNGAIKNLLLKKNGSLSQIEIRTNGLSIALNHYSIKRNDFFNEYISTKSFDNVGDIDFDWIDFSKKLLDLIHSSIYNRQEVAEAKVKNTLR